MADREFKQLVGTVGRDPKLRDTKIGQVLKFSLAVKLGYGEEDTTWYEVAVFNEGLKSRATSEIHRGLRGVVVEGFASEGSYQGKTTHNIIADRLGLAEHFAATRKGQSAPAPVTADAEYANV